MQSSSEQARALRGGAESGELLRADAFYLAAFAEPFYGILGPWERTFRILYEATHAFEVRPENIRWEGGNQPADALVICNVATIGVLFRFRLSDLEIWTNSRGIIRDQSLWRPFIRRGTEALGRFDAAPHIASHTFTLGLHWRYPDRVFEQEVSRIASVSVPDFRVISLALASAPSSPVASTTLRAPKVTVEMQRSLIFQDPEAMFTRVACEIDGGTPIDEACEAAEVAIAEARARVGIDLDI